MATIRDHYQSYQLESRLFGYRPNNWLHFLWLFIMGHRWH